MSPEEEAAAVSEDELTTSEPFDAKMFEEIEAAEETESAPEVSRISDRIPQRFYAYRADVIICTNNSVEHFCGD
ncbi:unnamed protein product [Strongylus vulgaris]|uniref:Uncharacterized protein n=1 Tax=Strongylus vulgaris TaxID=40348 RepID=A0A3P7K7U1_STRVU|nr:unnamed protein product [Strongylus vulgaris]